MATLILGAAEIARVMGPKDYFDASAQAFERYARGRMSVPAVVHIPSPNGAFHVKSAGFSGKPNYIAVKVNGNFPGNPECNGLPTIQGAIVLCDGRDGSLLAVMDSGEVTAMRTAAASAVAARFLALPDTRVATIIGCGVQGRIQLQALRAVLPLAELFLFDSQRARSDALAAELAHEPGLKTTVLNDFAHGTRQSGLIVTCTSSRQAFLHKKHVAPGAFIAAVGADNHDKQELDPELVAAARVVVDVLDQCAEIGELHHALQAGVMQRGDVAAELGAVVAGEKRGRAAANDIVVFDSTGSAIQDVAAAGIIYERATAQGLGVALDLS